MSEEQINMAIAVACGWSVQLSSLQSGLDVVRDGVRKPLPDYCNDLNAMHEAEQQIFVKECCALYDRYHFIDELGLLLKPNQWFRIGACDVLDARARQRAEAFLRTLGKWEEVQS